MKIQREKRRNAPRKSYGNNYGRLYIKKKKKKKNVIKNLNQSFIEYATRTGSGVTLIPRNVWKKKRKTDIKEEPYAIESVRRRCYKKKVMLL